MKRLRAALICLAACLPAASARAVVAEPLRFERLELHQGRAEPTVYAFEHDAQGQLWLATTQGLLRQDGRRAVPLQPLSRAADALLYALKVDDERRQLWMGGVTGLSVLDLRTDRLQPVPPPAALHSGTRVVTGIATGPPGSLWVLFREGALYRLDIESLAWTPGPLALPDADAGTDDRPSAWALVADGAGGVWASEGAGAVHVRHDGRIEQRIAVTALHAPAAPGRGALPPAAQTLRALALDARGRLWIGSRAGLDVWEVAGTPVRVPMPPLAACGEGSVNRLLADAGGDMWMSLRDGGLCRWRSSTAAFERVPLSVLEQLHGRPEPLSALFLDRDRVLWVGVHGRGATRADLAEFTAVRYVHDPAGAAALSDRESVQAAVPLGGDRVLVGSYAGDLRALALDSGESRALPASLRGLGLLSALRTSPGHVWLGSQDDGLYHLDLATGRLRRHAARPWSLRASAVNALATDEAGDLWVGTAGGVDRLGHDGRWTGFGAGSGMRELLGDAVVNALQALPGGAMLVGGRRGLRVWEPSQGRFAAVDVDPAGGAAAVPEVLSLHRDQAGQVWIGAVEGLFQLVRQRTGWRMAPWRPREGQVPAAALQDVRVLQQAADGALWLAGAQGAVRIDPQAGTARLLPSLIAAGEVNYGAVARLDDGRIVLGAGNGLHAFQPADLQPLRAAPRVALSQVSLFNQPLQAGQPALAGLGVSGPLRHATALTLAPGQNVVGFEFAALWHGRSGRAHYAWRLQGFDSGWNEGQGEANLATYTNLDPGRYVLEYRAALDGGPWSTVPGRLEITVRPPFWRTGWWYALMAVLALSLLLGAYHLRMRALKAARLSLEAQVAARTRQVVQQQARLAEEKAEADRQREAAEAARGHIGALSELGREVMATLDAEAVCRTLCSRLALLIDVRQIRVLRTAGEGQPIEPALAWEDGAPCTVPPGVLDAPGSLAARCIHGTEALSLSRDAGAPPLGPDAPGWAHAALLVPLSANGVTLGALAVFHAGPQAYGSVQLDLLRTLAGHVAGALGNAEAYRRLRLTQAALVEREKMAALGSLVAGVAHELNTPIGNGLLLASTLQDQTQEFAGRVAQGGLRRSELQGFADRARDAADLIVTSLHSAAALVRSFKQVAVDQTADARRRFELRALCDELAATLANQLRPHQHTLTIEVADGLVMDSYPGSLGQVLSNLILNAVQHGFEGRRHGAMRLEAGLAPAGGVVRIVFADDGAGIAAEHLPRIFEPFFTTRLGCGGSGLGLHISYNIVTSLLGGAIAVQSAPGRGARFELLLPHTAPRREARPQGG